MFGTQSDTGDVEGMRHKETLTFPCSFLNEPLSLPEVAPRALTIEEK